ncbi:MBL fold metallo-hydrolase [Gemmatimonadota bacterium]
MRSLHAVRSVSVFLALLCATLALGCRGDRATPSASGTVKFTWITNTTWLIEVGEKRILHDAFFTRIDLPSFDLSQPETLRFGSISPDTSLVRDVLNALAADQGISHILVGHGHVDHTLDLGLVAGLTDAEIIGSRTACLQAVAQGIPPEQCISVEGGEVVELAPDLEVRIVRWSHSGDPSDPRFRVIQAPLELISVPWVDPETGALDPSFDGGYPNGGGVRAFLFTYRTTQGDLRWLVSDSGNPYTFDGESSTSPEFFESLGLTMDNLRFVEVEGAPREWLVEAVEEEGFDVVDLWLATGPSAHVRQIAPILKPLVLIPHHWGGFGGVYSAGVRRAYDNPNLQAYLDSAGIQYLPQRQYLDRFLLTAEGVHRDPNTEAKLQLGLRDSLESR